MSLLGRLLESDLGGWFWMTSTLAFVGALLLTLSPVIAIATAMNILGRLLGRTS